MMRIALIADIHGNLAALDVVLDVIARERPNHVVCLGDVAATGPQPREVLARLRAFGCPMVMGNADAELLDPPHATDQDDEFTANIRDISRWCADRFDAEDRAFIASFRPTVDLELGSGMRLLCCHGSPRSFDDIISVATPDEEIDGMMSGHAVEAYAGGHTHVRMLRAWRGREIINPGSVGLAYRFLPDGSVRVPAWAEFALLSVSDESTVNVDFRRVPYDLEATVRAMHERGMPHAAWWAADWG
jgi:predicted phosphodiesterase